jgi:large repetitive protein
MNRSIYDGHASRVRQVLASLSKALRTSTLFCALVLAAAPPAFAQTSVDNVARVTNPTGLSCSDATTNPTCERADNALITVTPAAVDYDFCPVGIDKPVFSIVNGVRISRYDPGAGNDAFVDDLNFTVAGNLNALMVDAVRNRLLFISRSGSNSILWAYDSANGGWYQAAAPFASPDFARAGMAPDGTGYLIAGGVATPEVWEVTADPTPGSFGYTVQNIGTLSYDIAPTDLGSGDIALDAAGAGWLSAGQDLYRIDFSAGLQAVRQTRPLLNGSPAAINWAGVAFADDGTLYVADNSGSSSYYAYNPATGVLTPTVPTTAGASRDLASCAFPTIAEPDLSVVKSLAQINGVPASAGATVAPGDTLTYAIQIANTGGSVATLFPGRVVETLPANTAVVTAGNDFTCTGSNCPSTAAANVAAGNSITLGFIVQVSDPLPANVTAIDNAVAVTGVNCAEAGNDCTETTPLSPIVTVDKSVNPGSGTAVSVGATLTYTLTVNVANAATTTNVELTDVLGTGLTVNVGSLPAGCTPTGQTITCVLTTGAAIGTHTFTYTATVDAAATTSVSNSVTTNTGSCVSCTTTNPVTPTVTVSKSVNPGSGTAVSVGATLTYTLTVNVANAATTANVELTDVLGTGLTVNAGSLPAGCTPTGQTITCVLTTGAAIGTHTFTYTATVDATATTSVSNSVTTNTGSCVSCTTTNPVTPTITVNKSVNPGSGTAVVVGATLTYTLTVNVANAATTADVELTDTLGAGLTVNVGSLPAGCTPTGQTIRCILTTGAAIGLHTFTYTATVDATATTSVSNSVTTNTGSCVSCTTTNPVTPTVTVNKSVNPGSGTAVAVGATLTYTLTVNVANAATTADVELTDTLGAGLTVNVGSLPAGCTPTGQTIRCILTTGAAIGLHTFTYTATVDATATTSVSNNVTTNTGSCVSCTTTNPVTPTVTVNKSVNPGSGTAVSVGATLTYTLTVNVANAATTANVELTDVLGTGLSVVAGSLPAGCTPTGQTIICTLGPSPVGTYTFAYSATVGTNATTSVSNSVTTNTGSCVSCTTTNPVTPTVTVNKSVNPGSGTAVSVGATLTYTLTVNVANAATTADVELTDTLGAGLNVNAGSLPAGCTPTGQTIRCILTTGAAIGTHTFTYTATIDAAATTSVSNSVSTNTGSCISCTTTNPITPTITVNKAVNPGSGTAVSVGSTLTYTLSITVANAATTVDEVLEDTLGAGLTVNAGSLPANCPVIGQVITCTLGAGAAIGTHTFTYTATVDAAATTSVSNSVTTSTGSCVSCTTTNPVTPTVTVSKSVNPSSGTAVSVGNTLTYTLTVNVANAATTANVELTDVLGTGLTVNAGSLPAGCTPTGQTIICTLGPSPIGTYTFAYSATVGANATTSVSNSVTTNTGSCVSCTTTNPVDPSITVSKSVNPGSGTAVVVGATLTYTLTVNVANAATTTNVELTDTLGAGLNVNAGSLPAGCTPTGQTITCILTTGAAIGLHTFTYTATVDATATTSVSNSVTTNTGSCVSCTTTNPVTPTVTVSKSVNPGSGTAVSVGATLTYTLTINVANAATTAATVLTDVLGAGLTVNAGSLPAGCTPTGQTIICTLDPSPIGTYTFVYSAAVDATATTSVSNSVTTNTGNCVSCTTTNPVDPSVTVSKSVNPGSGTAVSVGATLTYTLTVNVANAPTTAATVLTDVLGTGLTAGSLPAGCSPTGQTIICTLGASPIGAYTFVYSATVDAAATTSVSNSVTTNTGSCVSCTTTNPVTPTVTVSKSVNPGSGTAVSVGATLTYTLTVNVANAPTIADVELTDVLGTGLTVNVGSLPAGCTPTGQTIRCILTTGAAIGLHAFTYTATVDASATTSVSNSVTTNTGNCVSCTTTNPVTPTVTVNKSVNPGNGTAVSVGATLTYTLTIDVANASTTADVELTDVLGTGLTVNAGSLPAGCTPTGQTIRCILTTGAAIGLHTFTYTATVDATATTTVSNSVTTNTGNCVSCTTTNPVTPTVTVNKSVNPGSGTAVSVGDTLTYTLTVNVANAATTADVELTDVLGTGLTVNVGSLPAGCTPTGQTIRCILTTGAAIGLHTFTYTAAVDATATTSVSNSVTTNIGSCVSCTTTNPVDSTITVNKSVNPGSGTAVSVGSTLTYTLTINVANATTTVDEVLTDVLGAGLTIGTVPTGCTPSGQTLTCTLGAGAAIGTHTFTYTATVDAAATTSVSNSVTTSTGSCVSCTTTNPVTPTVTVSKSVNPGSGTAVSVGDTLTYTLTINVANAATTAAEVLTDVLGTGLTIGTVPAGCTPSGQTLTCTLGAGAAIGTHTFIYTATVDAAATTSVSNSVTTSTGSCTSCTTTNPVASTITVNKSVNPGSGTAVSVGSTLTYTLTVNVANAATTVDEVLTDVLGAGLTIGTVPAGCTPSGQTLTCTLGAGAAIGTHTFTYTATVDATATTSVSNTVTTSTGTCSTCSTTNPLTPTLTVSKSVNPASGTAVSVGDTLTYTLTVNVANAATTVDEVLTDTLGAGLVVGTVPTGCTAAGQVITCTLATGAAIGTHTFAYTATVGADATTSVSNSVTASTGSCASCTTTNPVAPRVAVNKTANPANGETVEVNDTVTYTVTVTVANSATIAAVSLTDTLSAGQTLLPASIQLPAGGACNAVASGLECSLAAGTTPGSYAFVYQARVDAGASGTIGNSVVATGGGGEEPDCQSCSTEHRVAEPIVAVTKSSNPGGGTALHVGDTIQYTLTVNVAEAATTSDLILDDTPSAGLTLGALPAGCTTNGSGLRCVLPSGSVPGTYSFTYPATINANTGATVNNVVLANGGGSQQNPPTCSTCSVEHEVVDASQLRVIKTSSVREARIGDLVRYTVTVENVGASNVHDADLVDTPPAGFTYVDGSLSVTDDDNAATTSGYNPIRFEGLDIDAGQSATLVYLMRIGAGVRPGVLINQAQTYSSGGTPISNVATAELTLAADPLIDDSLILGTVFDDRDSDGWQDNAALTGVRIQGGFDSSAYVPGSTTIDRGDGPQPVADASAPLLHGIALGDIGARQSPADPVQRRQIVLRQRLSRADFTGDFVLSSKQGVTLRMDAAGATTLATEGEAAKGLNAAAPEVERRVAQGEGGYVVDYIIRNAGIDERGIPGVRIASVDGLLVETDQFGRYHLAGIPGGAWERGRNFILKVDPSTLPPGTQITTDNPLIRRITPGLPVRFDFGAKLPTALIQGGERKVELELGEVIFAAGSAQVRERYLPTIEQIAAKLAEHRGGEVVISADGESEGLAFDRATAVRTALLVKLPPETANALSVNVRTMVNDPKSLIAGVGQGGPRLGMVLFDTDRETIRPEFAPLLDRIAGYLETARGGTVSVVGHADVRGAATYNLALGMRRAKAVYEAIAQRLSPEVRSQVRVELESSNGPAPAGNSK